MKYKGLKPINSIPFKGIYTRTAKIIFNEFLNSNLDKAEVDIEFKNLDDMQSLYNSMKSLLRRDKKYKGKINCSINKKEGKIFLWKS